MDPDEVMKLIDSSWFELEILKNNQILSNSSNSEKTPDREKEVKSSSRPVILHTRSRSAEALSLISSSFCDSSSPNYVLPAPKLHTILSGKEITEQEDLKVEQQFEASNCKKKYILKKKKRKKSRLETKSLSDLEFKELKGFMDLGFVFSEEDKDSTLASIIPGINRLGKREVEDDREGKMVISRPYLSEKWEGLEREKPLMMVDWRFPSLSNEIDMKNSLKWWAHTVASTAK